MLAPPTRPRACQPIRDTPGREVFAGVRPGGPWIIISGTQFKLYPHFADARAKLERS